MPLFSACCGREQIKFLTLDFGALTATSRYHAGTVLCIIHSHILAPAYNISAKKTWLGEEYRNYSTPKLASRNVQLRAMSVTLSRLVKLGDNIPNIPSEMATYKINQVYTLHLNKNTFYMK